MNIVNRLTIRHLRLNKGRTLITVIGIMLSVSMICAVAGFTVSFKDALYSSIEDARGNYHLAYIGVTMDTASKIATEDIFDTYFIENNEEEGLFDIYLRMKAPQKDYWEVGQSLLEKYSFQSMMANTEILALEGVIANDSTMRAIISLAIIVTLIIVTGSVIVIANGFYISSSERVRQFGMLKSVGATKSQIKQSIVFEAFFLGAIAVPLGILLGLIIQAIVLQFVNSMFTDLRAIYSDTFEFRFVFDWIIVYVSIAVAVLTLLISAWLPASRAAKISSIDAIRGDERSKNKASNLKNIKASSFVQALFGFEGTLAVKSLKSNKVKYRATVISLVMSIVLFISMSWFVWFLNFAAQSEYAMFDFDALVTVTGSLEDQVEIDSFIRAIPDADVFRSQHINVRTKVKNKFIEGHTGITNDPYINIMLVSDDIFAKISPVAVDKNQGILLNLKGKVEVDKNTALKFRPYNYEYGMELPVLGRSGLEVSRLVLVGEVTKPWEGAPWLLFAHNVITVLLPETAYTELANSIEEQRPSTAVFTVKTDDPSTFCQYVLGFIEGYNTEGKDIEINVADVSEVTVVNRSITTVVMLFGYGFIAMLSLIAFTGVITTISTGVRLRRRELVMLYSIGMTPESMDKMFYLESLMYGLKSIIIGVPIGVGLTYFMYYQIAWVNQEYYYELPLSAATISSVVIMVLTFATMYYSKRKLKKINIVDAVRSEVS